MGNDTAGRVALMSIHPEYAYAILSGSKKVEFRKRPISDDVTHVIVYATAPTAAVVGAFTVTGQETTSPTRLWKRFSHAAGISRTKFFAYYSGRRQGTGIQVGDVLVTEEPLGLYESLGVARPPQSFQYLASPTAREALDQMVPASLAEAV